MLKGSSFTSYYGTKDNIPIGAITSRPIPLLDNIILLCEVILKICYGGTKQIKYKPLSSPCGDNIVLRNIVESELN